MPCNDDGSRALPMCGRPCGTPARSVERTLGSGERGCGVPAAARSARSAAVTQRGPAVVCAALLGALRAMAREVLAEWKFAAASTDFREWLAAGAPSEDRGLALPATLALRPSSKDGDGR